AESQTRQARAALESILKDTESSITARRADDAAAKIASVRIFAPEYARVAADLQSISALFVAHAKVLEEQPDWPGVVKELEKADATVSSSDTDALLKNAREQG